MTAHTCACTLTQAHLSVSRHTRGTQATTQICLCLEGHQGQGHVARGGHSDIPSQAQVPPTPAVCLYRRVKSLEKQPLLRRWSWWQPRLKGALVLGRRGWGRVGGQGLTGHLCKVGQVNRVVQRCTGQEFSGAPGPDETASTR